MKILFKKGQIVYVSNDEQGAYHLYHFADHKPDDTHPYRASSYYQEAIKGVGFASFKYCLSVEDYQKMINQPKDKDLVWAWDNGVNFARSARFYDARNNRTFNSSGHRGAYKYDNYEVIPRDQWPEWAIDVHKDLED